VSTERLPASYIAEAKVKKYIPAKPPADAAYELLIDHPDWEDLRSYVLDADDVKAWVQPPSHESTTSLQSHGQRPVSASPSLEGAAGAAEIDEPTAAEAEELREEELQFLRESS
jgi:hypothetical protein